MKKIKTALIGCGKVAHYHARALAALPQSDFVAVYGRDLARAEAFARQYQVAAYNDVSQMVKESGAGAVVVCTPHPAHAAPAIQAMRAGAHALVEKPLASSLADCDAMIATAKKSGVLLGGVSQRRFYEPVQRLKRALDDGKIGRPVLGLVTMLGWRDEAYYASDPWRGSWTGEGGGVLVNQAPHQLDLLQWFMGPVTEVYGSWANFNHPYIEVEDTAIAVLKFASGALGNIVVSNSINPALYGKVHVFGKNGAGIGVQTDGGAMFIAGMSSITEPPVNDLWTVKGEEDLLAGWQKEDSDFFASIEPMQYYYEKQDADFLTAILQGSSPLVTAEEARRTVEIFSAIYKAKQEGLPQHFPLAAY